MPHRTCALVVGLISRARFPPVPNVGAALAAARPVVIGESATPVA